MITEQISRDLRKDLYIKQKISHYWEDAKGESSNYYKVVLLGVNFLLLFTCYGSAQNMIGQLYDQMGYKNLGNYIVMSIYGFFAVSNFFATYFLQQLSYKYALFFSSFGYVFILIVEFNNIRTIKKIKYQGTLASICQNHGYYFYCSENYIYPFNIIAGGICGMAASIIWLAQSAYINCISDEQTKGAYFGIFYGITQTYQLLAGLSSAILLQFFDHFVYFACLSTMTLLSTCLFLLLPNVQKLRKQQHVTSIGESFYDFRKCFFSNQIVNYRLLLINSGVIAAVYSTFLYKIVNNTIQDDENQKYVNTWTSYCFVALGGFEFIGGMISVKIMDKYSSQYMSQITVGIISTALTLLMMSYYQKSYKLCLLSSALFGLGDVFMQSICSVILSKNELRLTLDPFTIYRFLQCIGVISTIILQLVIQSLDVKLDIFILTILLYQYIVNVNIQSWNGINSHKGDQFVVNDSFKDLDLQI